MEQWHVFSATMVGLQEKILNSKRSRMAKTITFWLWWQQCFNSFCFGYLSFFPFFFHFATQKSGVHQYRWPWFIKVKLKLLMNSSDEHIFRSSRSQMFFKIGVLKNFTRTSQVAASIFFKLLNSHFVTLLWRNFPS